MSSINGSSSPTMFGRKLTRAIWLSAISIASGIPANDAVAQSSLVRDGNFQSFALSRVANPESSIHRWGTGLYSRHGVWWNSKGAQSTARRIEFNSGNDSSRFGLLIENRSKAAPHVFGTTSQRIKVDPQGAYWISFWARADRLATAGAVSVVVDQTWTVRPIALPAGSYPWRFFSGKIDCRQIDTASRGYIDLRLLSQDIGTVYITGMRMHRPVAGEADRVRALMVIDTDSNLSESVRFDRYHVKQALEAGLHGRLQLTELTGRDASPQRILDYYRRLKTGPSETLLFYYAGHGYTDRQRGHTLKMTYGGLTRQTLLDAMRSKGAQLNVVLTDCCSNFAEFKAAASERERTADPAVFRSLFLRNRGLVDINACSTGQSSWGNGFHGGYFTNSLTNLLYRPLGELDPKREGLVRWKVFYDRLRHDTRELYSDMRNKLLRAGRVSKSLEAQPFQTPESFAIDVRITTRG